MGLIILYRAWRQTRPKVFSWRSPFPLGLIAGGVVAAPFAGWMTKIMPLRILTWIVGFVVVGLAIWQAIALF
jgi:hypothetical protein